MIKIIVFQRKTEQRRPPRVKVSGRKHLMFVSLLESTSSPPGSSEPQSAGERAGASSQQQQPRVKQGSQKEKKCSIGTKQGFFFSMAGRQGALQALSLEHGEGRGRGATSSWWRYSIAEGSEVTGTRRKKKLEPLKSSPWWRKAGVH